MYKPAMATRSLADELPPHYTDVPDELPLTFQVGAEKVSPLVNVTEIQAHLRLLQAFRKLRDDVYNAHTPGPGPDHSDVNDLPTDKDRAWVIFVNRAVYRFDKFLSGKWADWPRWSEAVIPPLDVVMIWHTYLLVCSFLFKYYRINEEQNPRVYHEDSLRRTTPFSRRLIAME